MSMMSLAAMPAAVESRSSESSFKIILLFCCAGLVASLGVMARGIDLGAALI
ncbi:hypothetical protein HIR48_11985 [Staphylococcus coagulans]|nr:hypothetical protein [Staphylococcus coagulans]